MLQAAARRRSRVVAILLAAGGSSRLGSPKQLVRRRMRPLLTIALDAARGALGGDRAGDLIVVLGASHLRLRALLRREAAGTRTVLNPRWKSGLASSLAAGLDAAPRDARAALVLLVDQPDVDAAALRRLVAAWRRRPALPTAARYDGRAGVPAVFPRTLWTKLRALDGDAGARAVLRAAPEVTLVDLPEAVFDVDTREDVARLRNAT